MKNVLLTRKTAHTLTALMLPVVAQNLLSAIVNSADVFMLSSASQSALSASSLAAQITFVFSLFHWSATTGTTIMASQYYGKRDTSVIRQIQGLGIDLMLVVAAAFCAACLLIPQGLMRIFTNDAALIALGADFLRVLCISYLPMAATQVMLAVFKSMGQTRLSAIITTICLLCNITLNFISIRVLFPHDPRMAMMGVAAATVIARTIELLLCLLAIRRGHGVPISPADLRHIPSWVVRDFAHYTLPVHANQMIYGLAMALLTAIMGHMGSDMVSANAIASNLRELVSVACYALSTAGAILLGQEMGAGRLDSAKALGRALELLALILGAAAGALLMLIRGPIMYFSGLEGEAGALLEMMVPICAVYCIGRSYNATMISGVFCSGGDTRFGVILDTITMWLIVLPLSFAAAFVFNWPAVVIYMFLNLDEFVKMIPSAVRFRQYKWLKNLTRSENPR